MVFKGLWTYPQLAACLLQARPNTAGLGLGSERLPMAARVPCYRAAPPRVNVKNVKKREGVRSLFKIHPTRQYVRQLNTEIY